MPAPIGPHTHLIRQTIDELGNQMQQGGVTASALARQYLERIAALDDVGPRLGAVLETNPDALPIAAALDEERASQGPRGPLHGIPVLIKDNLDTADSMHTSAGSLALMTSRPHHDATVVKQLRDAGAIILGKTNLSEWANMRGKPNVSGWSGRGQTRNPHCLVRNPGGSSSGSAAAVAAGFAPVAIGTETDGSVICPGSACGVVGLKPTVGLTSRAGVIPISTSQDSVGIFATNVRDIALTLEVMTGIDPRDPATAASKHMIGTNFTAELRAGSLRGVRLGVPTNCGYQGYNQHSDAIFAAAVNVLEHLGAVIVHGTDIPTEEGLREQPNEMDRLLREFRIDMNRYLSERGDLDIRTLADIIAFNRDHAEDELRFFGQEVMEMAEATSKYDAAELVEINTRLARLSRTEGIDAVLAEHHLDALIAPSMNPAALTDMVNGENHGGSASTVSAIAGYPMITVPAGLVYGLPVGISFMGAAWSEPALLAYAYAWEQATHMYRVPTFDAGDTVLSGEFPQYELPQINCSAV